jgi:hypothetical protein
MNALLTDALKQLRLGGLAESLPIRLQEAQSNRLAHAEFLELLLQDELALRRQRQIERRIKTAAFRELKSLEDFDWEFNRSIKRKQMAAKPLADRQWQAPAISSSDGETGASRHALSTRPHEAFGTAGYMPPEQELGQNLILRRQEACAGRCPEIW